MTRRSCFGAFLPGLLLIGGIAACDAAPERLLGTPELTPRASLLGTGGLLACPASETRVASSVIDASGGTVSLDGHEVLVPAGALAEPTRITLTAPASDYLEIELMADELDQFEFTAPVYVTVSYKRCQGSHLTLSAWHIDPSTKAMLAEMDGLHQRLAKRVTFPSDHFSGFALAN